MKHFAAAFFAAALLTSGSALAAYQAEGQGHVDTASYAAPQGEGHVDIAQARPEGNGHVDIADAYPQNEGHVQMGG